MKLDHSLAPLILLLGLRLSIGQEPAAGALSFRASPSLWQRGDVFAVLLVSICFIAAASMAFAYDKHRRLKQSNLRLREADQLKSDFVANVSHELRTPIGAILGYAENLIDGVKGPLTDEQIRSLCQVIAYAERLRRLIDDLLDLARIESGRLKLDCTLVKLEELAAWTVETFNLSAAEQSLRISLAVQGTCPRVWADRDRLLQVYTNIVGNALKFTPRGGEISIIVKSEGQWVYSAIRDTGPGIPPEEQKQIFGRFHQVAREPTGKTVGIGLGLAICKELIELHGGSIGVESTLGQGSTFYFRLPVVESASEMSACQPGYRTVDFSDDAPLPEA